MRRRATRRRLRRAALGLATAGAVELGGVGLGVRAAAAEIRAGYPAIEQLLLRGVFTQDGRRYLDGTADSRCRYTYLDRPKVDAVGGRLRLHVKVTARLAIEMGSSCVGPGDAFDAWISGVPAVSADTEIYLSDLKVETPNNRYGRLVSGYVQSELARVLRVPLKSHLERAASEGTRSSGLPVQLDRFVVQSVTAEPDALKLVFDLGVGLR